MSAPGTVVPEAGREVIAPRGAIDPLLESPEEHLCWFQPDLKGCSSTHILEGIFASFPPVTL